MTATDLALTVTQMLRKAKVVGKFVEFYGPGAAALAVVDRATIANMAPGIRRDHGLLSRLTPNASNICAKRAAARSIAGFTKIISAPRAFSACPKKGDIAYSTDLELDLATVVPSVAGPKRPQDRIELGQLKQEFVPALFQAGDGERIRQGGGGSGARFPDWRERAGRAGRRQPGTGLCANAPSGKTPIR